MITLTANVVEYHQSTSYLNHQTMDCSCYQDQKQSYQGGTVWGGGHGSPKHIISDRASVFIGDVFTDLLDQWDVKPRFGAIRQHGSISVTERVIKTLKYEWLKRVPIIKGFDHLTMLCEEFECWYNSRRPHMTLEGFRPDDIYYNKKPKKPKRDSKTVPCNIEQHLFRETRIMGYRLKAVA